MRDQQDEKIQLNEMITLYIANPNNYHNQIRVMFHVPSLKSYVLKVFYFLFNILAHTIYFLGRIGS